MNEDETKREYLQILLTQYSETRESIRSYSNAEWQIPLLLVTTISVIGIVYGQLRDLQVARVLALSLGFGFTLVSIVALKKHRFFACHRTRDFEDIERQIQKLLEQEDFQKLLKKHEIEFRRIKFKSKDLTEEGFYRTSAYNWQLGLAVIILVGIAFLLFVEFAMFLKPYL